MDGHGWDGCGGQNVEEKRSRSTNVCPSTFSAQIKTHPETKFLAKQVNHLIGQRAEISDATENCDSTSGCADDIILGVEAIVEQDLEPSSGDAKVTCGG